MKCRGNVLLSNNDLRSSGIGIMGEVVPVQAGVSGNGLLPTVFSKQDLLAFLGEPVGEEYI